MVLYIMKLNQSDSWMAKVALSPRLPCTGIVKTGRTWYLFSHEHDIIARELLTGEKIPGSPRFIRLSCSRSGAGKPRNEARAKELCSALNSFTSASPTFWLHNICVRLGSWGGPWEGG